jgi:HD-GYP domain-containing protein (c-di-GMP phosphodiesterase class II)
LYQSAIRVNLLNLLLSLSDALDLYNHKLTLHQLKTAYIASEIGKVIELSQEENTDLLIAALFHDIGAFNVMGIEEIDDHGLTIYPKGHCDFYAKLINRLPLFEKASKIVKYHATDFALLDGDQNSSVGLCSQIIMLADEVDRMIAEDRFILYQKQAIVEIVKNIPGMHIKKDLIDPFLLLASKESFWLDLVSPRLYSILLHSHPCKEISIELSSLRTISEMFRDVIDLRSRFTSTHSTGVAATAVMLSQRLLLTDESITMMEIAGNLHDIGKLSIPLSILDKPDRLTGDEFEVVKKHPYHAYNILNSIDGIQPIVHWVAFHHERLDGSGYPFHLNDGNLSSEARVMAISDIFTALSEERPYRHAMRKSEVIEILVDMAKKNWLDVDFVSVLLDNYDDLEGNMKSNQEKIKAFYEEEFLQNYNSYQIGLQLQLN